VPVAWRALRSFSEGRVQLWYAAAWRVDILWHMEAEPGFGLPERRRAADTPRDASHQSSDRLCRFLEGRRSVLIEAQGGVPRPTGVERNPGYKTCRKYRAL